MSTHQVGEITLNGIKFQTLTKIKMSNLAAAAAALKQKPKNNIPATGSTVTATAPTPAPVNNFYASRKSLMQDLQTAIRAERHLQGLTQRQLASKAGMSQGTITRAECHGWVSIWTMLRIIDALGKKIQVV